MVRRRPGIVPSDIKRQTHGFAESTFVIFENLRARKMLHDFLIRGSGCSSFVHYTLRSGTFNHLCGRTTARILRCDPLSATVVHVKSPDEGGVDESLPSQIRGLLPAPVRRCRKSARRRFEILWCAR